MRSTFVVASGFFHFKRTENPDKELKQELAMTEIVKMRDVRFDPGLFVEKTEHAVTGARTNQ